MIRGTDLSLTADLSGLKGFGTSLASGVDVDLNTYNGMIVCIVIYTGIYSQIVIVIHQDGKGFLYT